MKKCLTILLIQQKAFLDNKKHRFQKPRKMHFFKWVSP